LKLSDFLKQFLSGESKSEKLNLRFGIFAAFCDFSKECLACLGARLLAVQALYLNDAILF
jgi:hypothetical protein